MNRRAEGERGQTGSFLTLKISNRDEPKQSCQTCFRERPVCPPVSRSPVPVPPARTWMLAMTEYAIYLDDSGHPSDKPRVIVAGFLASEEQWLNFDPRWKEALKKYNLGDAFHMTDFESSKRKDRGEVLECLTGIIGRHTLASFSSFVDMAAYKKLNELYILEEFVGTPYSMATRGVNQNIELWKKRYFRPNDHLLIFVEEGTKHKGDMEEAFRRDKLPVPRTVPKKHPCVQPGDILAWEIFNYHMHQNKPIHRSFKNLLKIPRLDTNHRKFLEHNMRESCELMKIPLRKTISPEMKILYSSTPKRPRKRTIK
jgi:hypothetical protein